MHPQRALIQTQNRQKPQTLKTAKKETNYITMTSQTLHGAIKNQFIRQK